MHVPNKCCTFVRRIVYIKSGNMNSRPVYKGEWQFAETIRERLAGPIGDGEVLFPNGDRFAGFFHLNYAHINGPCYAAEGQYTFADGAYIEQAWLVTSTDMDFFRLTGVYRVHRPDGIDSVALFRQGMRYGIELFLTEHPYAVEWYADERIQRLSVSSYELNEDNPDCVSMSVALKGGRRVQQTGGRYSLNRYDQRYYEPNTEATLFLPNGDSIDHWGCSLKNLHPFDNYVTIHCKETQKCKDQTWKEGRLVEDGAWTRDPLHAWEGTLPHPLGEGEIHAFVWQWGEISYNYGDWEYDGEIADNRPDGQGVLEGMGLQRGKRYEGAFHNGLAHGKGVFVNEKTSMRLEGEWQNGVYQDPHAAQEPIILHAQHTCSDWEVYSSDKKTYKESDFEVQVGKLTFDGFRGFEVVRIERDKITIEHYGNTYELLKGGTLHLYNEIEGREWSDGCVYDGTDYTLILTWKEQ